MIYGEFATVDNLLVENLPGLKKVMHVESKVQLCGSHV
jgi:hypothetical protein